MSDLFEINTETIQSVVRAFRIVELLDREGQSLPLGEIAHCLELNKSTTRRFLITLQYLGYINQDPLTHQYQITPQLSRLGQSAREDVSLVAVAKPILDTISRETGETINFGILDGSEVYYLDKRDSTHPLRLCVEIGGRATAYATALGKAMLAFLPDEDLRNRFNHGVSLQRYTEKTLRSWAELEVELVRVRESGIAFDNEELFDGLRCMAVPIFKLKKVVAAISISVPLARWDTKRMEVFKMLLIQQGHKLSEQLSLI